MQMNKPGTLTFITFFLMIVTIILHFADDAEYNWLQLLTSFFAIVSGMMMLTNVRRFAHTEAFLNLKLLWYSLGFIVVALVLSIVSIVLL